jgi:hypothetical protein
MGNDKLPPGVRDPKSWNTEAGALAIYREAVQLFEGSLLGGATNGNGTGGAYLLAIRISGLMSDELQQGTYGGTTLDYRETQNSLFAVDARQATANDRGVVFGDYEGYVRNPYRELHVIRARSAQGIAALERYAPRISPALRGHLYALAGVSEILLADMYCSGVPLSTLDFEADFTYRPGSPTAAIYTHAAALFDTALSLASDSIWVLNLARIGKARALLSLGNYSEAANIVKDVPTSFVAKFPVRVDEDNLGNTSPIGFGSSFLGFTVSDREGNNGYPYRSTGDPRTQTIQSGTNRYGQPVYFPEKYKGPGQDTFVVYASGIEARLIEAEDALNRKEFGIWLSLLNSLRQNYAPSLSDIVDPGSDHARVDTLFGERAAWLFLTAHRQGDLRRLIRQYGRTQNEVYPVGSYPGPLGEYGIHVTLPIPEEEWINPYFRGCISREA